MTAPVQASPQQDTGADAAAIAALGALLAAGLGVGLTAALARRLIRLGFAPHVAAGVAQLVASAPAAGPVAGHDNTARRVTAVNNLRRRAEFILAAAHRVTTAVGQGTPLGDALTAERRFWAQHRAATAARTAAARKVDHAAAGATLLRWKAVLDPRTDSRCRQLDGTVFPINRPPAGAYPGQVHPACRCRALPVRKTNLSKETPLNPKTSMIDPATGAVIDLAAPAHRQHRGAVELADGYHLPDPTWDTRSAAEQGHYGHLDDGWGPRTSETYDRSGRHRLDVTVSDAPTLPPPSREVVDIAEHLTRNAPHMVPSLQGKNRREIAEQMMRTRPPVPANWDAATGTLHPTAQRPTVEEEAGRLWCRPGETDLERRNRIANDDADDILTGLAQDYAAAYARKYGLV